MGNCITSATGESESNSRSSAKDRQPRPVLASPDDNVVKTLLLGENDYINLIAIEIALLSEGAGESGKSTLVKQIKIIHGDGFNQRELQDFAVSIGYMHGSMFAMVVLGPTAELVLIPTDISDYAYDDTY